MKTTSYALLFIAYIAFIQTVHSVTINVPGGTINSNTTWNADTVRVNGNVTIGSAAKLTITQGTYVLFTGYYKLTVNGIIRAVGAPNDTIVFTRYQKSSDTTNYYQYNTNNGGWSGIELNTTITNDSFLFRYCRVEFIKNYTQNPESFKFSRGKRFDFRQSVYRLNQGAIAMDEVSNVYIDSCLFDKNNYYNSNYNSGSHEVYSRSSINVNITNSEFRSCSNEAIRFWGLDSYNITIANNQFKSITKKIGTSTVFSFLQIEDIAVNIKKNTFVKQTGNPYQAINIENANATIDSNTISNYTNAIVLESSSKGKIRWNNLSSGAMGIDCNTSHFLMEGNTINGFSGKGIFLHAFAIDTLKNNIIKNNGRGIEMNQVTAYLNANSIVNNTKSAIFYNKSTVNISNCLIANNSEISNGSALTSLYSTTQIINTTIANNSDNNSLGAPIAITSSNISFVNTLIWGNVANGVAKQIYIVSNDQHPNFYNCNIEGGSADFIIGAGGTFSGIYSNCLNTNPLFKAPTSGKGSSFDALAGSINWALETSSPLINSGKSDAIKESTDLKNNNRVLNGIVDIGALEVRVPKQVYGGGDITGTTRWYADTIVINNNFSITNTGKLTIDPGITILFTGYYKISCQGILQAIGKMNYPIKFTRNDTTGFYTSSNNNGAWAGIDFTVDNTEDDTSFIKYCNLNYLKGQISISDRYKVVIYNSNLFNNRKGTSVNELLYVQNSIVSINDNSFFNNLAYNDLINVQFSSLNFSGNQLYDNNTADMRLAESDLRYINNQVYNNYVSGNDPVIRCSNSKAYIVNNLFYNNSSYTLLTFDNVVNSYIANNTIASNLFSSRVFYIANSIVENNLVYNNSKKDFFGNSYVPSTFRNNYISTGSTFSPGACIDCVFDNNPMFIKPSTTQGPTLDAVNANWQLSSFSKAINKGYSNTDQLPQIDFMENSRIVASQVDCGAIENQESIVSFVQHPQGGSFCVSDSMVLFVQVSDTANLQWNFNGNKIAGEKNDTLIIKNLSTSNQGTYTCSAVNGFGTTISNAAIVNINSAPEVLSSPESRFVNINSILSIDIPVSGSKPINFLWKKNENLIPGLNKPELKINPFLINSEGTYYMIAENSCGKDTANSFTLLLTPVSFIKNNDTLFCEGEPMSLIAKANVSATFQWYKNSTLMSGATNDTLYIPTITSSDEGSYTCLVTTQAGEYETSPIVISVKQKAEINSSPLSGFYKPNNEVKLTVNSNGSSPIQYMWFKDGSLIPGNKPLLVLPNFSVSQQGLYKVVVLNECGSDTSSLAGQFLEPLLSVNNPNTSFCNGKKVTLKLFKNFTGNISWYLNNNLIENANSDSLQINSLSINDIGNYECVVESDYGTISSNQYYITTSQAPEFTIQPQSQWVTLESSTSMEVSASGSNPILYQWFKNDTLMNGENSSRLLFAGISINDQNIYRCIVSNICGKDTSNQAALMISPVILVNDTNVEPIVCENRTINLSTTALYNPTYKWFKEGQLLPGQFTNKITINNINLNSTGNYTCQIINDYGQVTTSPVFLQIKSKPGIVSDIQSSWVSLGTQHILSPIFDGSKPFEYKWYKNKSKIINSNSFLEVSSFSQSDTGIYICVASNDCGIDSSQQIRLTLAPELINVRGSNICQNDTFELKVKFNESASYQWIKDGKLIPGETNSLFRLNNVTNSSIGNYSCKVYNKNGFSILGPVLLQMKLKPVFIDQPLNTWAGSGQDVTFSAFADGETPITYQWFKNGVSISNESNNNLILKNISIDKEAFYKISASNECGTITSQPAKVSIVPNICMVRTDEETGKNMIVWERNTTRQYKQYNIYRETVVSGEYQTIGSVPFNTIGIFLDTAVNPRSQAYLYKLTAVDSLNNETPLELSKTHKNIHLLVTRGVPSGFQLDWDEYYGFNYGTYQIYRSIDSGSFKMIHEQSASTRTWTDFEEGSNYRRYYVAVQAPQICNPSKLKANSGPFSHSVSNLEDNRLRTTFSDTIFVNNTDTIYYSRVDTVFLSTSIKNSGYITQMGTHPNPFTNQTRFTFQSNTSGKIVLWVSDLSGKLINETLITSSFKGNFEATIGASLKKGVYLVHVMVNNKPVKVLKMIKQ